MKAGPGGVELSAGARAATALLEEADANKPGAATKSGHIKAAVSTAVEAIAVQPTASSFSTNRRILWVDDRPENNRLERRAFQELGLDVRLATSTDEALKSLAKERFDVVISDMGRQPDHRAGYTLLGELRRRGNNVPFVIYAGSGAPEHNEEARRRGAIGATNRSAELMEFVTRALNKHG